MHFCNYFKMAQNKMGLLTDNLKLLREGLEADDNGTVEQLLEAVEGMEVMRCSGKKVLCGLSRAVVTT